jgi:hypothetical protein
MRYRRLSQSGDNTFGQGTANFFVDDPQAVAQSVQTRLALWQGSWFLDQTVGTPIAQDVVGYQTMYDAALKQVILGTEGVTSIASYSSEVDPETRALTMNCSIYTQYSAVPVELDPVVI